MAGRSRRFTKVRLENRQRGSLHNRRRHRSNICRFCALRSDTPRRFDRSRARLMQNYEMPSETAGEDLGDGLKSPLGGQRELIVGSHGRLRLGRAHGDLRFATGAPSGAYADLGIAIICSSSPVCPQSRIRVSRPRSPLTGGPPIPVRDAVRNMFVAIAWTIIFVIAVMIVAILVRVAFVALYQFTTETIPQWCLACLRDPWLFLAIIVAALIVWSQPWKNFRSSGEPDLPRRGSHLKTVERSSRLARRRSTDSF